ncbi:MAG: endonuclease domain-containing protein [Oscillospiraceae bacterium]|nr:endonuclease domain-containing protein [Oscillospiraceae bacterium]
MIERREEIMLERARELRKKMTPEEKHLWYDFLKNHPVRFRKQEIVGNYILDFYCSKAKVAIEIDGAQHYTSESLSYDKKRTDYLEGAGIKVIRLLNKDINKNFENACKNIDSIIKERIK